MIKRGASSELSRSLLPLAALGALILFDAFFVPHFLSIQVKDGRLFGPLIDILHRGSIVVLLAIGMTLVIATRGIDLSVGATMAITGAVCALMLTRTGLAVEAIVPIGLAVAATAGVWNGVLVAYARIQPIVATLILMVAGRGVAQLLTDGQIVTFENKAFEFIGNGALIGLPFTIFIAGGVFAVALFLARKTIVGLYIEAVGGNEVASEYSGVNTAAVKLFVYGFCGLCAGIAGMIATSDIKAADVSNIGLNIELDAILAVVIGGTRFAGGKFNLIGSVLGALLIQTLTTTILMRGVGVEYTLVVKALVVIAVCVMQSPEARRRLGFAWEARTR
jgi:galactofuranose transport system permease protein